MRYKCPLCLDDIIAMTQLIRFCTEHADKWKIIDYPDGEVDEDEFEDSLYCPEPECQANDKVAAANGVFLSHIGCKAVHPFWDENEGTVKVPGDELDGNSLKKADYTGYPLPCDLIHWQISMLRKIKYKGIRPFMWFPIMLLRATGRRQGKRKLGSIVALVGDQRVGKTILAMQSMDPLGYRESGDGNRNIELNDFVYSTMPEGVAENRLVETLLLRQLMYDANAQLLFKPRPNIKVAGDLKVTFIKPSEKPSIAVSTNSPEAPEKKNGSGGGIKRIWSSLTGSVSYFLSELFEKPVSRKKTPGLARPYWHTVMLYDTSGESSRIIDPILEKIIGSADKIAILVSAPEVIGAVDTEKTILIAKRKVDFLANENINKSRCLIVTQMDLIMDFLGGDEDKIKDIAEDLDHDYTQEAKELVKKWLKTNRTHAKDELAMRLNKFERIFFIWTVKLPEAIGGGGYSSKGQEPGQPEEAEIFIRNPHTNQEPKFNKPKSYGLAKFICWTLDVKWSDINQA